MIKVKGEVVLNELTKTALVSLFADTKEEVIDDLEVNDIPAGYSIEFGSSVLTSNGDLAFRKSDNTWNWV